MIPAAIIVFSSALLAATVSEPQVPSSGTTSAIVLQAQQPPPLLPVPSGADSAGPVVGQPRAQQAPDSLAGTPARPASITSPPATLQARGRLERLPPWLRLGALAALGVTLIGAGFLTIRRIVARRRSEEDNMPIFAFPARKTNQPIVVDFPLQQRGRATAPPTQWQPLQAPLQPQQPAPAPPPAVPSPVQPSRPAPAELIGMPSNADETIQLLPGRLEVASSNGHKKEVRFVKGPGPAVVTFGRQAGTSATHVQVDSPTVSRLHASMRFTEGRWRIQNLSATNPVMVNGATLQENGNEHMLNDGDRVEMGDVIFHFWSR